MISPGLERARSLSDRLIPIDQRFPREIARLDVRNYSLSSSRAITKRWI
jgi:hypothetical protein